MSSGLWSLIFWALITSSKTDSSGVVENTWGLGEPRVLRTYMHEWICEEERNKVMNDPAYPAGMYACKEVT